MEPIKASKLWSQAGQSLLTEIRAMAPGENRLPPEEELARAMNISRATVREAMQALVREGYITRRHGKGNFAHPSVAALAQRIDLTADFRKLLRTEEGEPDCRFLGGWTGPASAAMAERYPLPVEEVYAQRWRYAVGEKPMIFCTVETPTALLRRKPGDVETSCRLTDWLSACCGQDAAYYATHLSCRANTQAARALGVPESAWMQNWQQVIYSINDAPIAFCDIYFHPQNVDLTMVLRF